MSDHTAPSAHLPPLLAALRQQIAHYQALLTQDPTKSHYAQGVLGGLLFAEQQIIALANLPESVIPSQFQAILGELAMRQQMSQQQGLAEFNPLEALAKLLQSGATMHDVTAMMAQFTHIAQSEGYRIALNLLQQVKF
jgi:hypothetical protein